MVNLIKGQKLDLTKATTNLTKVRVGLGWTTADTGVDFDLDASAFVLNRLGRVAPDTNFVFYNNLVSTDGSIVHTGDNRTGGDSDSIEEEITVDFTKISPNVESIAIVVTIHDAESRNQFFGQVRNAFVTIVDDVTGKEISRYNLEEDSSTDIAMTFCELVKEGESWTFRAVGEGSKKDLGDYCRQYGLNV